MSRFPRLRSTSKPTSRALMIAAAASGRDPEPGAYRDALQRDLETLDQRAAAGEPLDEAELRKARHLVSQLDGLDKAASTPAKAAAASPVPSSRLTPVKAASAPSVPPAPRQPRLSAQERKKIIAEVQAELAAEAKAKRQAAASAAWDRALARMTGAPVPASVGTKPQSAASASWDRAYARVFPNQPTAV